MKAAMTSAPLSINTLRLQVAPGICFSPATADGGIVLNVERGTVLSLNQTGAWMFLKLTRQGALTRDEFLDLVRPAFHDVKEVQIENAVDSLLHQLINKGVLLTQQGNVSQLGFALRSRFGRLIARSAKIIVVPLRILRANLIASFLLLTAADAILSLAGFNSLYQAVKMWSPKAHRRYEPQLVTNLCLAAEQACTWFPKQALCLQRSVVLTWMLRSYGINGEMVIGVHKMPFYGHAWVEVDGKVLNDDENVQKFFHAVSRC